MLPVCFKCHVFEQQLPVIITSFVKKSLALTIFTNVFQLQEFEAAIKQRDGIITQLTANLQQARREKAETMREFLELTEQSQKLQIQFQHVSITNRIKFIRFLAKNEKNVHTF